MFKRIDSSVFSPYVRPEPSAPPLPEQGAPSGRAANSASHPYIRPEPSAPLLPEGIPARTGSGGRAAGLLALPLVGRRLVVAPGRAGGNAAR